MRLEVRIPSDTRWITPRGRNGKRYAMEKYQREVQFETTAYRVALPAKQNVLEPYVWADVWIPEAYRSGLPILDPKWIEAGVYRARVSIERNRKTLAPFLESGLMEMDVREAA
jgi:hypothetical protein